MYAEEQPKIVMENDKPNTIFRISLKIKKHMQVHKALATYDLKYVDDKLPFI